MHLPGKTLAASLFLAAALAVHAADRFATVADPDGFTNLRSEKGEILERVRVGDPFVLLEHDKAKQRWHVRLLSGNGGYIHESRIRPISRAEADRGLAAKAARLPRAADSGISGITWLDVDSAERVIGPKIKTVEEDGGFPTGWCLNAGRTEQLELTLHYGAIMNDFSVYTVRAVEGAGRGVVLPKVERFVSAKGVRLGLTEKELTGLFGKPIRVENESGKRILEYRVSRSAAKAAGEAMRDPELYFGRYHFRGGQLVEFEFGFEYP